MSDVSPIHDLPGKIGQTVTLRGWLQGKRSSGKIAFLLVRDGTGVCQCIVEAAQPEAFAAAEPLGQESSLAVTGTVRAEPRSPGGVELAVTQLSVYQNAVDYPITRKEHGIEFLMQHRHLWLRSPRQTAILRIRHTLIQAARGFFDDRGFILVDSPIFQPGAAEGAGTLFGVDYFGDKAYLAQTGQLYLETAAMALGKVYCFGPTFRAEKSKTRRHLSEFWMLEPEVAFFELPDLERLAEDLIAHLVQAALRHNEADLLALGRNLDPLRKIQTPFPRITYSEAVDLLHSEGLREKLLDQLSADRARLAGMIAQLAEKDKELGAEQKAWKKEKLAQELAELREQVHELETDLRNRPGHIDGARAFEWGHDLGGDEETILSKQYDRPLIVTEYPREVKAFYMKRSETDPRVVRNLDVLAPEGYGEIIGGSQREDDLDLLLKRMEEELMDPAPYQWYLDLRRYGSVPHGGFGLGLERTVAWICGLKHIRESVPYARMMGKMIP
jgi:asparaginyl-tRNA synthetase